ncbi:MAG: hypothetical protein SFY69_03435 [Planctomycetota bacterium]|nr:hypothetical protein [Planctomycetota bacterium]
MTARATWAAARRAAAVRGRALAAFAGALAALSGGCGGTPDGDLLDVVALYGEAGDAPGQFSYPRCLDATQTHAWVIDKLARVQKIDVRTGECVGGWRMPEWQNGKPTGVTVWTPPAGGPTRIIIADTHYHRVMVYDPAGIAPPGEMSDAHGLVLASFGSYGEEDGQFIYPTDVCVLPTDDGRGIKRLYVAEYGGNDRVSVFEPAVGETPGHETRFTFLFAFGEPGAGEGRFNRPQSLFLGADGTELVVVDACNHRLARHALDGTYLGQVGLGIGNGPGEMKYPYAGVVLSDGSVMVSEFGGNRLQRFDLRTGASLGIYGRAGRSPGELASPWGVAVAGTRLLVLDSGNNRVQSITAPGRSMWSVGGSR